MTKKEVDRMWIRAQKDQTNQEEKLRELQVYIAHKRGMVNHKRNRGKGERQQQKIREEGKEEGPKGLRELRHEEAKWKRIQGASEAWSGAITKKAMQGVIKALAPIIDLESIKGKNKARRKLALETCKAIRADIEEQILDTQQRKQGDRILKNIMESVGSKGESTVKIYDAIHTAKAGVNKGSKIAAVYTEGGKEMLQIMQATMATERRSDQKDSWIEHIRLSIKGEENEKGLERILHEAEGNLKQEDRRSEEIVRQEIRKACIHTGERIKKTVETQVKEINASGD